ncbi:MAG: septum formation initiator family protein [Deltaproteobacteria bacterium]|jgi:cell division protein FtsB|nr:septum formation initiator family protein [Deltaproteobacteria bacterium]
MLWLRLILSVSIVLNAALLFDLIWGQQGIIEYKRLYEQCRILEGRIAGLETENILLSKEIRLLQSDDKYVEKVIRNRLHFIRDNEIRYIFPDESGLESSGALLNEPKN